MTAEETTPANREPLTAPPGNDPELSAGEVAELHRLARSRPRSGRASLAKLGAIRALERLSREGRGVPACPPGWHPGPPEFEELDRAHLEAHPEVRERWWRSLYGAG